MPDRNVDDAFRLLDQDLCAAPALQASSSGSSLRADAHRRRRTSVAASSLAVVGVVAGASVLAATLPSGSSPAHDTVGAAPAASALPTPTPCADPSAWDIRTSGPDPELPMSMSTGALTARQLTAADLGADWTEGHLGRVIAQFPGTKERSAYVDVDGRELHLERLYRDRPVDNAPSWDLFQSTFRVREGTGAAAWQAALDRLLCTTPVHPVEVLANGNDAGAEWLVLHHSQSAVTEDEDGHVVPGKPSSSWVVIARTGDVATSVGIETFGDGRYLDSEPPTAWLEQLATAVSARLVGATPPPVSPLTASTLTPVAALTD